MPAEAPSSAWKDSLPQLQSGCFPEEGLLQEESPQGESPQAAEVTPSAEVPQTPAPRTVVVSCPLEQELADAIVAEARETGRTAQDLLAHLIRTGWEARS